MSQMELVAIVAVLAAVVGSMLAVLLGVCVGYRRLRVPIDRPSFARRRLRAIVPYGGALVLVLAVNKGLESFSTELSWAIGVNATGTIYAIEGGFVRALQQSFPEQAALYFSFIYVFGYVVLLVFPMIAYFFSESIRSLKLLLTAYAINYAGGVICYILFIAYGPRNIMPDTVNQPMFELFPEVMLLTSSVNTNTNVFPSLHTSLSVTAMAFAVLTRDEYPRWVPVAMLIGWSVVVSTMYLGIHWLIDVLAGIVLGVGSVYAAKYAVDWYERMTLARASPSETTARSD